MAPDHRPATAMQQIPFNIPLLTGLEQANVQSVFDDGRFAGNHAWSHRCNTWLREQIPAAGALVTSSCTHALEMAAIACDVGPGDEVIMASYGFSSTANAFALRGATIVFVDVHPGTMNIDPACVANAITSKTKVIVPMHYAGVSCDMDALRSLASEHGCDIVEDAAQAIHSTWRDEPCGTMGRFGTLSFHETKNVHCGEGGALLINRQDDVLRSEILQEKGTDRTRFRRGEINKYTWVDIGSSYLPTEMTAAFLHAQLEASREAVANRCALWSQYHEALEPLEAGGHIQRPIVPDECRGNGHLYFIKVRDAAQRTELIHHLALDGIQAVFHYIPLHSAAAGQRFGRFHGEDRYTTRESERLLRLPMHHLVDDVAVRRIATSLRLFFQGGLL